MDREPVGSVYWRLLEAWNRRDAHEFAALFTDDGHAVGFDGSEMEGRAEIASVLATIFQTQETPAYVAKIREIREIAPGVALLRSVVGMVPVGELNLAPALNAIQSVVFVEQNGDVRIALLQSTPAAFHGRPEVAAALAKELLEILQNQRVRH